MKFGRPLKDVPADFDVLVGRWEKGEISVGDIVNECEISEATFYRRLKELRSCIKTK